MSSISGAVLINDNVINIKRGQDNHDIPVTIAVPGAVLPNITHRHYLETSAANRSIGEVAQSWRRPLLGPSPG